MKKTVVICITAILCSLILCVPFVLPYLNAKTASPSQSNSNASEKEEITYENIEVIGHPEENVTLLLDKSNGNLYWIKCYINGNMSIETSKLPTSISLTKIKQMAEEQASNNGK